MARAPEKKAEAGRRQPETEKEQRRDASASGTRARAEEREDLDPREEEGWTQPESSAQKGALPDSEEG